MESPMNTNVESPGLDDRNVGDVDRAARIVAGLFMIGLTLAGQSGIWFWIGVLSLLTGIRQFCLAYSLLGINTCEMRRDY